MHKINFQFFWSLSEINSNEACHNSDTIKQSTWHIIFISFPVHLQLRLQTKEGCIVPFPGAPKNKRLQQTMVSMMLILLGAVNLCNTQV